MRKWQEKSFHHHCWKIWFMKSWVNCQKMNSTLQKCKRHLKIVPKSKYHIFMSYTKGALNVWQENDPGSFYQKFYSSLPLQAETLSNKAFPESLCKVIVLHLGDELLAFSKPSSSQSRVEISLKDAERGPLNYLGGYILRNFYRKKSVKGF